MQNNDFDKQLQQLWQQQETVEVNAAQLKRSFKWMRIKHFGYAFLDIACVLAAIVFVYVMREKFSTAFLYGISVFIFISIAFTLYLLYLRRYALLNHLGNESTQSYLALMVKQTNNNIRIAWITQHSCWVSWLILVALWLYLGVYDDMPHDVWLRKTLMSALIGALIFIPLWFWASWRRKKFMRMRDELVAQQYVD
ncbi:hypothetical protein QTP81_16630 [Alteromonas sp. ASW11-36]|uniref:RDD family protein n=1 Tax=Alteromonas arenosi TaxID=3055817 RepID=A0ABT7T1Y1_9ALTE|nr:hypothetical protein [Alteromonas sp. ASW11-36]MDM7862234.1 hypothetical protein [Alteromonas sp. ASW11-36]